MTNETLQENDIDLGFITNDSYKVLAQLYKMGMQQDFMEHVNFLQEIQQDSQLLQKLIKLHDWEFREG